MTSLAVTFFAFVIGAAPIAQGQSKDDNSSRITVIKKSWTRERIRPFDQARNQDIWGDGRTAPPLTPPRLDDRPNRSIVIERYAYRATIKNVSDKTVVAVGWDYTFADPGSKEVTHHRFMSRVRIKPGKKTEIIALRREPPTVTVSAKTAGAGPIEDVEIVFVNFKDGTHWRRTN